MINADMFRVRDAELEINRRINASVEFSDRRMLAYVNP